MDHLWPQRYCLFSTQKQQSSDTASTPWSLPYYVSSAFIVVLRCLCKPLPFVHDLKMLWTTVPYSHSCRVVHRDVYKDINKGRRWNKKIGTVVPYSREEHRDMNKDQHIGGVGCLDANQIIVCVLSSNWL